MAWQRVTLIVPGADAEQLSDALDSEGAISTDLADADADTAAEREIFAEPGGEAAFWARCRVTALFPMETDVSGALERSGVATLGASIDRLEEEDWVALTQRQFDPIRAGARLWIVPTWHAPPEPDAVNVVLDPGAAFGTGSHPTTRLVLGWLERHVRPGDAILDYGCGSGILGIAALMMGAGRAIGVDVDPLALEAARYNSRRNQVRLDARDANGELPTDADITVANILANPLRMLAPLLATHTRTGGLLALSGILEEQAQAVAEAYAPWMTLAVAGREAGWVLLAGRRER